MFEVRLVTAIGAAGGGLFELAVLAAPAIDAGPWCELGIEFLLARNAEGNPTDSEAPRLGDGFLTLGAVTSALSLRCQLPQPSELVVDGGFNFSPPGEEASKLLRRQPEKHQNFFGASRRSIKTSSAPAGEASKLVRRPPRRVSIHLPCRVLSRSCHRTAPLRSAPLGEA